MAALVLLAVVFHDPDPVPSITDADFHVLESDAIYFKNLRQYYYQREERKDAGFEIFRLRDRSEDTTTANISFAIVSNGMHDQAYIMLEWNNLAQRNDSIHLLIRQRDSDKTFSLGSENMEKHLALALNIYRALIDPASSFTLMTEDGHVDIWMSSFERNRLKRMLKDSFKLIGVLR